MTETVYPRLGERVFRCTLSNGLPVIVVRRAGYAHCCAFLAVGCGGMDLRFRQDGVWKNVPAGTAHYLEHKMFDTKSGSVTPLFARTGASENAFTSSTLTAYHVHCTGQFEENLCLLLSFVSEPYFTQESVEREQGIIAQEIQETEDDPDWHAYQNLIQALYRAGPVRQPVAGTTESIQQITPQILYDCHRAFYTPSNMALVCVGDIDPDRVAAAAEAILPRSGGSAPVRDYGPAEDQTPACSTIRRTMDVPMPVFLAGYKLRPPADGEEFLRKSLVAGLACDVLFGDSSPLYTRLYEAGTINSSLGGGYDLLPGAACLYVGGDAQDPDLVFQAVTDQAQRLGREGIDPDFYRQIRRAAYGNMIRDLNSFGHIAEDLAEGCFRGFDHCRFPELFDRISQEDVETFLREEITPDHAAISRIDPAQPD